MKNFSITTIILAVLGVTVPIVWDYYKSTSAIDVQITGRSTIFSKPEKMDSLVITYNGEVLNELSKTTFSIVNSGRTPILKKDVALPISMQFEKTGNIIDAKIDNMHPTDLGASILFIKEKSVIVLDFPLLNPGDSIDFSILAATSNIKFDASGRIAGVASLLVKDISQEKAGKRTPWVTYPVAIFSFILALATLGVFMQLPAEVKTRKKFKRGELIIPQFASIADYESWVNTTFSFTTVKERKTLIQIGYESLGGDNVFIQNDNKIFSAITEMLISSTSNLTTGLITLSITAWGVWYVYF
jgi:hypothetical protein